MPRRLYDRRMVGQAQVIIGAKVDDRPLRDADAAPLRAQQDALGLIQPRRPDLRELLLDKRFDLVVRHLWPKDHFATLPFAYQAEPSGEFVKGRDGSDDRLVDGARLEEPGKTVPG